MNKAVLGTILGSALLGLIGHNADKEKKVQIGSANKSLLKRIRDLNLIGAPKFRISTLRVYDMDGASNHRVERLEDTLWSPQTGEKYVVPYEGYWRIPVPFFEPNGMKNWAITRMSEETLEGIVERLENMPNPRLQDLYDLTTQRAEFLFNYIDTPSGSANKPNRKKKFIVRSVDQGLKVIQHKDITDNWKKSLKVRPKHRVAVLLPCAATKPFAESPSHKYGYLKALGDKDVDLYVVSEPLGIIPYAWQDKYPNADYDYPPKYLKGKARKLLSERIGEWFKKVYPKYDTVYSALPGHHQRLVNDSTDQKLKEVTINQCRQDTCSDSVFRATAGEYVDYLKREIK